MAAARNGFQLEADKCRRRRQRAGCSTSVSGRRRSPYARARRWTSISEARAVRNVRPGFRRRNAGKYDGLEESLRVVKPSGFFVIDDMLPQPNWPEGHAAKVPVLLNALA